MLCICFNTCAISAIARPQSSNFGVGFCKILRNFELISLFFVTIIFGILCGVSIAFLTWYLQALGAPDTLIGTSSIMFCLFELPTLYFAGSIMTKLGMVNTMYLTFIIYAIRYLGYALMTNPWLIYAIEPLHGATSALMFTVTTAYAVSRAPPGLTATATGLVYGSQLLGKCNCANLAIITLITLLHCFHQKLFNISGRGIGSVSGGIVYDKYGPAILFFSCCALSGLGIVLLACFRLISKICSNETGGSQENLTSESSQTEDIAERSSLLQNDYDYGAISSNISIQNS